MSQSDRPEQSNCPLPKATGQVGLQILRRLAATRSPLVALEMMQQHVGNLFQIQAPGFTPAVMAGPEYNRQLLLTDRQDYLWRTETDPVTELLRRGVLVLDGEEHDRVRACMEPTMLRRPTLAHIDTMVRSTDWVVAQWQDGGTYDMLVEMRKIALLILIGTLFGVDFCPDLQRMWDPILRAIDAISPGLWILSPKLPRRRYPKELAALDAYLYDLIGRRRILPDPPDDLLTRLVQSPDMDDGLIRDQLLTMLIAGHDTSTALFAWMLYLLGEHPEAMRRVREEVTTVVGTGAGSTQPSADHLNRLHYLDLVTRETLRLYPPIHIGNRKAAHDVHLPAGTIPAGNRVMYSIYLSHRDPAQWENPGTFDPDRFDRQGAVPAFTYVPFGGGPRNCIGATFAQIEAKVVMARLFQRTQLDLVGGQKIQAHMGATLEPRPGVKMKVTKQS
ncbi:MAG: cytochrome P450 [Caldilineaceae bacterium]